MAYKVRSYKEDGVTEDAEDVGELDDALSAAHELREKLAPGSRVYIYDADCTPVFRWRHVADVGWEVIEGSQDDIPRLS